MAGDWVAWLLAHLMEVLSLGVSAGALLFAVLAYRQTVVSRRDAKRIERARVLESLERAFRDLEGTAHQLKMQTELSSQVWERHINQSIPIFGRSGAMRDTRELALLREIQTKARRLLGQAAKIRADGLAEGGCSPADSVAALRTLHSRLEALELELPPCPQPVGRQFV